MDDEAPYPYRVVLVLTKKLDTDEASSHMNLYGRKERKVSESGVDGYLDILLSGLTFECDTNKRREPPLRVSF